MKILQLVTRRQFRGAEVFAAQLSDRLVDAGHRVRLVGLYPPPGHALAPERAEAGDLGLRPWPGLRPGLIFRLTREIDGFAPDVIQANGSDTLKYAVIARRLSRRHPPLVYRNISFAGRWGNDFVRRTVYRFLFRSVDAVAAVSEGSARDFEAIYGSGIPTPVVIPNATPIPMDLDRVAARRDLSRVAGVDATDRLVVHVGSFTPEKNHAGLLHAFAALPSDTRLILFGDGPLRLEMQALARKLGVDDRAHFPGARPDAADLTAGADVLVLSSLIEGVPGVLLEAGAREVPVVATRVGGVPELVDDGETGCLAPPDDPEALAAALRRVLDDPALRRRLGAAARRRVREHHHLDRISYDFLTLYRKLVSEH